MFSMLSLRFLIGHENVANFANILKSSALFAKHVADEEGVKSL